MKNVELRVMISDTGLRYKDIAKEMGISREWLSVLMRHELTHENRKRIVQAVSRLKLKGEMEDERLHSSS